MFSRAYSLQELTFGQNFQFVLAGGNINLPQVPDNTVYAGRWRNVGTGASEPWSHFLNSTELTLPLNNTILADTWIWETRIRQYHVTYIFVDFMEIAMDDFWAGNLTSADLIDISNNASSEFNRTYDSETFAQFLRTLPIPALQGWELLYSYIIFENPTLGVSGPVAYIPSHLDVDKVSGNITIVVFFVEF